MQQEKYSAKSVNYEPLGFGRLIIVLLTMVAVAWYMTWRLGTFNHDHMWFSITLYVAEWVGVISLLMHFFMVVRLAERESPPVESGHTVDVLVPTINESVDVLRRTVVKAMDISYPHQTYILDDGNRQEVRQLATELGCHYLSRGNNKDAKAGNLNYALEHTTGEFIALFDADHAPKNTFLTRTLGYFADPKVAFVQTPQDFYNLDSYQHSTERKGGHMWTEQTLFFRIIQRGKDYWNAAFFCGSCAVIRRSALEAIGGFATGTVTEDIHTSIRLHKEGFVSVYHPESLAFGIAPAHVEPFIKQRVRWGQGAMNVWRKEAILFSPNLTFPQKICYLASIMTYFDGWQKFIYYITPAIVLVTGWLPIMAETKDFLLHFVPYFCMMVFCFEELGRGYGEMLIVEQYNMARFAALCWSTFGFFRNNMKFRVTSKKMTAARPYSWYVLPQFALLMVNTIAIPLGIVFFIYLGHLTPFALAANLIWATLNLSLAMMVISFSERLGKYRRTNYRFSIPLVAQMQMNSGEKIFTSVEDLSDAGMLILAPIKSEGGIKIGELITGVLYLPEGEAPFQAIVQSIHRSRETRSYKAVGCEFLWNNQAARIRVERFLYGSDFEWKLHNLSEKNWTLIGWLTGKNGNEKLMRGKKSAQEIQLASMIINPEGEGAPMTGIVSMDARKDRDTLITFSPLQENQILNTILFTPSGWQPMRARIANQNKGDDVSPNMYSYEMQGVPA